MKNKLFMAILLAFSFVGCQPKVQNLDVKQNQLFQKNRDYDITAKHSIFSSTDVTVNKSCQVLNGEIQKYVTGLVDSLKVESTEFFKTYVTDTTERPIWNYQLIVEDSVFMATDQYVSVRLLAYTYTGGAHGNTTFKAFNYDVKNQKMLTPEEILNYNDVTGINSLLKADFKNPDNCFSDTPTLDLVSVINVDSTAVHFTYEQYVLGAYACGVANVTIPRQELKGSFLLK